MGRECPGGWSGEALRLGLPEFLPGDAFNAAYVLVRSDREDRLGLQEGGPPSRPASQPVIPRRSRQEGGMSPRLLMLFENEDPADDNKERRKVVAIDSPCLSDGAFLPGFLAW